MLATIKPSCRFFNLPAAKLVGIVALLISPHHLAVAQSTPLRPPIPATTAPASTAPAATPLAAPKPAVVVAATGANAGGLNTSLVALKFNPSIAMMAKIRALPADSVVETSSGRKVTARQFVATMDALGGLSAKRAKLRPMDFKFSKPTAVAAVNINANTFRTLRTLPNTAVLQMPNGLKLTNGELKQLEVLEARTNIRQLMGSNISIAAPVPQAGAANKYAGLPAIKLNAKADLDQLIGKPDSTIVEMPDGTRSTLGELKATLAQKFSKN